MGRELVSNEDRKMKRWEYFLLRFGVRDQVKFEHEEIASNLNKWGAQGWEVVSTETIESTTAGHGGTLYFVVTLKREIGLST